MKRHVGIAVIGWGHWIGGAIALVIGGVGLLVDQSLTTISWFVAGAAAIILGSGLRNRKLWALNGIMIFQLLWVVLGLMAFFDQKHYLVTMFLWTITGITWWYLSRKPQLSTFHKETDAPEMRNPVNPTASHRIFRILGALTGTIGIVSLSLTSLFAYAAVLEVQTTGRIIDIQEESIEGTIVYRPIVEFNTSDGQTVSFSGLTQTQKDMFTKGESVRVQYTPSRPQDARLDEGNYAFLLPYGVLVVSGFISLLMFMVSIPLLYMSRR